MCCQRNRPLYTINCPLFTTPCNNLLSFIPSSFLHRVIPCQHSAHARHVCFASASVVGGLPAPSRAGFRTGIGNQARPAMQRATYAVSGRSVPGSRASKWFRKLAQPLISTVRDSQRVFIRMTSLVLDRCTAPAFCGASLFFFFYGLKLILRKRRWTGGGQG